MTQASAPNAAVRPIAYEAMVDPMWPALFEGYDAGVTRVPVEVCHPFFDLRLVDFLLALPALPWCSDKELLREAARGILPDAVRLRRKSPLLADPLTVLLQQPESAWVDSFESVPELSRYVERAPHSESVRRKGCLDCLDSSPTAQFELLVAVERGIGYKSARERCLETERTRICEEALSKARAFGCTATSER